MNIPTLDFHLGETITMLRDTVRAYAAIVERGKPGRIYNVCAGTTYRIGDVLQRMVSLSRVPVTIKVDASRYRPSDNPILLGDCGRIERLDVACPVQTLEKTIARSSGFKGIYHELEFYGQCPECAETATA